MNRKKKGSLLTLISFAFLFFLVMGQSVWAANNTIAVLNMQKAVAASNAGQNAQSVIKDKVDLLQKTLKSEEDKINTLKQEMEKKNSVWSDSVKEEKGIELQKMVRDLRTKRDDANLEIKMMREQQLGPILEQMEVVVKDVAQKKGYLLIIPKSAVLYSADQIDITAEIIEALNQVKK